eukprot:scaffold212_cov404-Prasinococcus_capsulatus_cf.AAC.7
MYLSILHCGLPPCSPGLAWLPARERRQAVALTSSDADVRRRATCTAASLCGYGVIPGLHHPDDRGQPSDQGGEKSTLDNPLPCIAGPAVSRLCPSA